MVNLKGMSNENIEHLSALELEQVIDLVGVDVAIDDLMILTLPQLNESSYRKIMKTRPWDVAGCHVGVPPELLEELSLSHDSDTEVVELVAYNPRTPLSVLERLSLVDDGIIQKEVVNNSATPEHVQHQIASTSKHSEALEDLLYVAMSLRVLKSVLVNPHFPAANMSVGLMDRDWTMNGEVVRIADLVMRGDFSLSEQIDGKELGGSLLKHGFSAEYQAIQSLELLLAIEQHVPAHSVRDQLAPKKTRF